MRFPPLKSLACGNPRGVFVWEILNRSNNWGFKSSSSRFMWIFDILGEFDVLVHLRPNPPPLPGTLLALVTDWSLPPENLVDCCFFYLVVSVGVPATPFLLCFFDGFCLRALLQVRVGRPHVWPQRLVFSFSTRSCVLGLFVACASVFPSVSISSEVTEYRARVNVLLGPLKLGWVFRCSSPPFFHRSTRFPGRRALC